MKKKPLCLMLTVVIIMSMLAGCAKSSTKKDDSVTTDNSAQKTEQETKQATESTEKNATPFYLTLDPTISGSLDVMVWSGDSTYYEDIGHQNWAPEDITTMNVAAVYAMAKKFNEIYPNVKINLYAKTDDPNSNDTPWAQELENFKAEHGKYPDIYAATDLAGDVSRGMVADLSVFADDPLYQSFNESLLSTMNYYGFQAGLPQYLVPWGVYVNYSLAEANNVDIPDPDWTIDEYTEVATQKGDGWWGAMDVPMSFINTGCKDITYSLYNYNGTGDHINLTTEAVSSLLEYVPKWATGAIWTQNDLGNVPQEIMDDGWWWGYRFFCRNYCITYDGDPWMIGSADMPQNEDGTWPTNAVETNDWDIYPRPSTDYMPNTVGVSLDPMAIHNYAMDDGYPEWSDTEKAQLDLAYAFGSFWCGTTDSMQARADQMFNDNGTLRTSLNDSFPLVTGDAFDEQMKIWYSVEAHAKYADAEAMPGFQKVVQLWKDGQIWDISDKTYPYYITEDGTQKECMYEWIYIYNTDISGALRTDPNWLDNVKARLADWNKVINERFVQSEEALKQGLITYYGFNDSDFK